MVPLTSVELGLFALAENLAPTLCKGKYSDLDYNKCSHFNIHKYFMNN